MPNAKHTPGPWSVDAQFIKAPNGRILAEAYMNGASAFPNHINARLIAAAPDMLAALRLICDSGVALAAPIEHAMLVAINKAEGCK